MEKKHKQRIKQKFPEETFDKNIVILEIEDNYQFMDPELIEMIKISVEPYISDLI